VPDRERGLGDPSGPRQIDGRAVSLVELAEAVIAQHSDGKRCKFCCQQLKLGRTCRQVRMAQQWLANADRSTTDASAGPEIESTVRRSTT
jgi:hypothetical protein